MAQTPNEPHLGDTLDRSRSGKVDPAVGETQAGSRSHERPSYSDPITRSESDRATGADRVPGAMSTTPEFELPRNPDLVDRGSPEDTREASTQLNAKAAPMRGAGTPVRPAAADGLPDAPDGRSSSGT